MRIVEAMNEDRLIERKLDAKIPFIKEFAARPSVRGDRLNGEEKQKVKEAVQSCMDLISRREYLRRCITYTNLVSSVEVKGKTYSLHALIQHKNRRMAGFEGAGICSLKKKVLMALDDRAAIMDVDRIKASQPKDASVKVDVVYNFDIEERNKMLNDIMEMEMEIDSAIQIANTKLEVLEPPKDFAQKA